MFFQKRKTAHNERLVRLEINNLPMKTAQEWAVSGRAKSPAGPDCQPAAGCRTARQDGADRPTTALDLLLI